MTCYLLELKANKPKDSCLTRMLWVDMERFLPLREELFAKGEELLNVLHQGGAAEIEKDNTRLAGRLLKAMMREVGLDSPR